MLSKNEILLTTIKLQCSEVRLRFNGACVGLLPPVAGLAVWGLN